LVNAEQRLLELDDLRLKLVLGHHCIMLKFGDSAMVFDIQSPRANGSPNLLYPRSYSASTWEEDVRTTSSSLSLMSSFFGLKFQRM
jgi:hypothetical protein